MITEFPRVRVAGGPRERGEQYGEQARARVRRSIEAYTEIFAHYAAWDWERVTAEARRFEAAIAAYEPRFLDEIAGIARGAGAPYEAVLALNVRTEIMFAARVRRGQPVRAAGECSSLAALPRATVTGHTLLGQNWDWLTHCPGTVVVLEAQQDDDHPSYVTVVEAGLLAKTGLNSCAVGLATNGMVTSRDAGEAAVPYHLVLRGILDARTIPEALAAIGRAPRASSANYLVGQASGEVVDIEAAPGDASQLYRVEADDGILVHTNHFLSPQVDGDVSAWAMPDTDSHFRHGRIREKVSAREGRLTPRTFRRVLSDHRNYPFSVCAHPDGRLAPHERATTVASIVMDLDARRIWLAEGHPCTSRYRELDYAPFLAGRP
jgi:isopenicillin-N N-acyltransferase-like protein